eukprot:1043285_1
MGRYLERTGVPVDGSLWSLSALIDTKYHSNVVSAHKSYLEAGCNIITTNTYSCVPLYLSNANKLDELESLYALAVNLAEKAKDNYINSFSSISGMPTHQQNRIRIAGSVPPLTESFRPGRMLTEAQSIYYYNRIFNAFQSTNIDLYLIETMSCLKEAQCVLNAMICNTTHDKDIYLFFTLREDGMLRDGQSFNDMIMDLEQYMKLLPIKYIGSNCCKPESFDIVMSSVNNQTLSILSAHDVWIGCYPNGLLDVPSDCDLKNDGATYICPRNDLTPNKLYALFKKWIEKYNNVSHRLALLGGMICPITPI